MKYLEPVMGGSQDDGPPDPKDPKDKDSTGD